MSIGVFFVMIQTYLQLRFYFRDINALRTVKSIKAEDSRLAIAHSNDANPVHEMEINGLRKEDMASSTDSISNQIFQQTLHDLQGRVLRKFAIE